MRARVIRWSDPLSSGIKLRVQRWCVSQWEDVLDFSLAELSQAYEFAMRLSLSPRISVEISTFEDGRKVNGDHEPLFAVRSGIGEKKLESQS
jgi:hypothetical protein